MINAPFTVYPTTFDDLEDASQWDGSKPVQHKAASAVARAFAGQDRSAPVAGGSPCPKCGGSGRVTFGYSYLREGVCFRCNGRGTVRIARKSNTARSARTAVRTQAASAEAFLQSRPDVDAWLRDGAERGNNFAISLRAALTKYGSLTPNQLAAVERNLAERAERAAARADVAPVAAAVAGALDLSQVPSGLYAVPGGDTRLKVRIDHVTKVGKWQGWVFVKDGAEYGHGKRYGEQRPGQLYSGSIVEELRAIAADPKAAAQAYGRLTGTCGICGRKLEDETSVAFGIGPVCRAKQGW